MKLLDQLLALHLHNDIQTIICSPQPFDGMTANFYADVYGRTWLDIETDDRHEYAIIEDWYGELADHVKDSRGLIGEMLNMIAHAALQDPIEHQVVCRQNQYRLAA